MVSYNQMSWCNSSTRTHSMCEVTFTREITRDPNMSNGELHPPAHTASAMRMTATMRTKRRAMIIHSWTFRKTTLLSSLCALHTKLSWKQHETNHNQGRLTDSTGTPYNGKNKGSKYNTSWGVEVCLDGPQFWGLLSPTLAWSKSSRHGKFTANVPYRETRQGRKPKQKQKAKFTAVRSRASASEASTRLVVTSSPLPATTCRSREILENIRSFYVFKQTNKQGYIIIKIQTHNYN